MTSAALPSAPAQGAASSAGMCYHCGLPVPARTAYRAMTGGVCRQWCCAGCMAVTQTIEAGGLEGFYRARNRAPTPGAGRDEAELRLYDDLAVQAPFVTSHADGSREATLLLEGIACAACVWLNERHLAAQPGVKSVWINYATRRARLRWDPAVTRLSDLLLAVQAIGYRAWPHDNARQEQLEQRERRDGLWRLFVAAFGMMQVMMYAWPAYVAGEGEMSADVAALMRWASLVLTMPVVCYSAAPFFRGAWRDLRLRRLGMDVPVALGVGAAFAGSLWATLWGRGEVYFDSVTMFVFFLLAGRTLEAAARRKAGEALRHLARAMPAVARRLSHWPASLDATAVPAGALQPGERVLVRPGDVVPADGVLLTAQASVDEALLTGESRPVARRTGETLTGGSVNLDQPLVMEVHGAGEGTRLAAIVRLSERAQAQRPALVQAADRVAAWFVAAIVLLAVAAALVWWHLDAARALPVAVAVLVVTCPCALSLATPAALAVATGAFASRGLVVTRAGAVEALSGATHVVMDKTGTLTTGCLRLLAIRPLGDLDEIACHRLAAALEAGAQHPVARALLAGAPPCSAPAVALEHVAGAGVAGQVEGRRLRLGSRRFVLGGEDAEAPAGTAQETQAWLADERGPLACFVLGDQLRDEAARVVGDLHGRGLEVWLASGDEPGAVASMARAAGIAHWCAALSPQDKGELVAGLQARGAKVLMVGDGINDAPVLARADVAVAMGEGAVLAQATADVVLTSGRLDGLIDALDLAARTRAVMRQNLAWAFAYNVVAVPLAALGWIDPWAAGVGMSASSLLVVVNALRLRSVPTRPVPTPRAAAEALQG
jgi:Cu2+-exporting ATPase